MHGRPSEKARRLSTLHLHVGVYSFKESSDSSAVGVLCRVMPLLPEKLRHSLIFKGNSSGSPRICEEKIDQTLTTKQDSIGAEIHANKALQSGVGELRDDQLSQPTLISSRQRACPSIEFRL